MPFLPPPEHQRAAWGGRGRTVPLGPLERCLLGCQISDEAFPWLGWAKEFSEPSLSTFLRVWGSPPRFSSGRACASLPGCAEPLGRGLPPPERCKMGLLGSAVMKATCYHPTSPLKTALSFHCGTLSIFNLH